MTKAFTLATVLLGISCWSSASVAAEVTLTGPVLSVYQDGFRIANERGQALRVFAWSLCGDATADHISRGDQVTVTGDQEWRLIEAQSVTKEDGSPACPESAAPAIEGVN